MRLKNGPILSISIFILGLLVVGMLFPSTTTAAPKSILDGLATVPKSSDVASSKYAVIAKYKPGVTKTIITGVGTKKNNRGYDVIVNPSNSLKGRIKILYTDIGTYKGRTLDFQIVVDDWEKAGFRGGEWMAFYDDEIGISQGGYNFVSLKGTYMYHDTGKPATDLTGSYMTINDLDLNQSVGFDSTMMKRIDRLYAYKNTWLKQWVSGGTTYIGSTGNANTDARDERAIFTMLVHGYQFDFKWTNDWHSPMKDGYTFYLDKTLDWKKGDSDQYFIYSNEKPVRTETLEPTKKIVSGSKQLESNTASLGDTFNYSIYHSVPSEYSKFYYDSYTMQDTIHKSLDIKKVKVFTATGEDVTDRFTISTSGNVVTAKAKDWVLKGGGFYGQDYRFDIDVQVKKSADLGKYISSGDSFAISNTAKVVIDGKANSSNTVTTTVKMPIVKLGLEKIQVFTNKANEGLPVRVYANVDDYHDVYKDEKIEMKLYQGSTKVLTDPIPLSELDGLTSLTVPSNVLTKGDKKSYKVTISTENPKTIQIGSGANALSTDGYTSVEKTFTEADLGADGSIEFEGVVMTEHTQGSNMKEFYEKLTAGTMPDQRVKSGYAFELYGEIDYSNDILSQSKDVTGIRDTVGAEMKVDANLVEPSLSFQEDADDPVKVPISIETSRSHNRSDTSYQLPEMFLEQQTGNMYTSEQKSNGEVEGAVIAAGRKMYVPVWIGEVGVYDANLNTTQSIGAHHLRFDITRHIDVYAYMFNHTDSETPEKDELLIHPMPQEENPTEW